MADTMNADIQNFSADAAKLSMEIADLDDDITIWEGVIRAATNVREIEENNYDTLLKDYSNSVEALQRATAVKKQSGDHNHGAFVQMAAFQEISFIPQEAKAAINAFLQDAEPTEGLAGTSPDANAYDYQPSIVVEMEKLLNKFHDELTTLEKQETNAKHAYELLMYDLNAHIAQGTQDRDEKAESKSTKMQANADASSAAKQLPPILQKASSLAALLADLNMQAKTRDAHYLAFLAKHFNSHDDPSNKVKIMIKDLIVRLMDEDNEEATI